GPSEHRNERPLGVVERLAEVAQLLLHQEAGHGGPEEARHRFRGGVRPVGRAERVVHVEVAQGGERLGECDVVRLFPWPEPRVLDQRYTAAREAATGRDAGGRIGDELDGRSQAALDVAPDLLARRLRVGAGWWAG